MAQYNNSNNCVWATGPFLFWGESVVVPDQIQQLIEQTVQQMGYEFVGVEFIQQSGTLIRVYVDTIEHDGIGVDALQAISGQLSSVLDVEDIIHYRYTLEVSSPGVDRILFTLAHYQRFIGHCIKIRLFQPVDDRTNFKGILTATTAQEIELEVDGQVIKFASDNIKRARLSPQFD